MYFYLFIALSFAICYAQQEPTIDEPVIQCNIRNGYYKLVGSCDAYVECMDYQPSRKLCPDGLNYNPKVSWPMFPCSYPADVPCVGRDTSQPPKPTADCPRQHGFFPSPTANENDCGQYRLCSEGHAYDMYCPFGLAFDPVNGRCDWPDLVPGCNSDEYFGFTCPAAEYDMMGNPLISNYRSEEGCVMFYSCQAGRARLLSCDPGYAFDTDSRRCVDSYLVNCDSNLSINDSDSETENEQV